MYEEQSISEPYNSKNLAGNKINKKECIIWKNDVKLGSFSLSISVFTLEKGFENRGIREASPDQE